MEDVNLTTFAEMIERIKDIVYKHYDRKVFDKDIADLLRISNFRLAISKNRNSPPLENILAFCYRTGLNPFSILFDQGRRA